MGLIIKKNSDDLYNLTSSISDECYHADEWISESDAKKTLIIDEFYKFIEAVVKIDIEFPTSYRVNGVGNFEKDKPSYYKFIESIDYSDDKLEEEFKKVLTKYDLKF